MSGEALLEAAPVLALRAGVERIPTELGEAAQRRLCQMDRV